MVMHQIHLNRPNMPPTWIPIEEFDTTVTGFIPHRKTSSDVAGAALTQTLFSIKQGKED